MIVNGVDISRKYTADEIFKMYHDGRLQNVTLKGYVSRANADGTCEFVHWTQANRLTGDADHRPGVYTANFDMVAELQKGLPPIEKRTPQQRVASLMLRIMASAAANDGKLGLSDAEIQSIVGESWRAGTPLTGEQVRRVAQHFLESAERDRAEQSRAAANRMNRKQRREAERQERRERAEWERLRRAAEIGRNG